MYWPIGIPKRYATHKQPTRAVANTNDGRPDSNQRDNLLTKDGESKEQGKLAPRDTLADQATREDSREIVGIKTSRNGHIFATITPSSLSIWQTKPTVLLTTVIRPEQSLEAYGYNVSLLLRPDALIIVVQTEKGFLVTYSLASDPSALVYRTQITTAGGHARRQSDGGYRKPNTAFGLSPGEGRGIREVNIRFRMVIRIDAGIAKALALDDELIVATSKPGAIQCIRWSPDSSGASHSTQLFKKMPWLAEKTIITEMTFDKPMNLHIWVASDGNVYAVQRVSVESTEASASKSAFRGFCFHTPQTKASHGVKAAVNARFSLIVVGCADASIWVYSAKDYTGNIPLSHTLRLPVSTLTSGRLTFVANSPDGYCIFAGFEKGWAMWSVYGKPGATSFSASEDTPALQRQEWLTGVSDGFWLGLGSEIALVGQQSDQICIMEMARSSTTSCFATSNILRCLLQTSTSVMIYRGLNVPDITAISGDTALWHTVQLPHEYLVNQWPIKSTVVSPDGRYVATAGRRGLAHYSLSSGRWKTFDSPDLEDEFTIRGGMCWYQHILLAAVEAGSSYEVRLYSREKALDSSSVLFTQTMSYPVIHMTTTGTDSLLVYTHENILFHYIFIASKNSVKFAQVGQIAFHGIIRAPARVRSISWIVPDDQREQGEPSQDVATAAVLFLVDGKLVLLQPSANEYGELKYDMRVVAHDVEYYLVTREQPSMALDSYDQALGSETPNGVSGAHLGHSLRDSLWYFDGKSMQVWPEILDVVSSAPADLGRELPPTVSISIDFYPLCAMIDKGILTGLESDLIQRRDVDLSYFRFSSRTHLFIPPLLRHHLSRYDSPAALHLSDSYQKLPYFAHALEVLLHDVLDDEVDASPGLGDTALLGSVLYFLSSFPAYLDIIVACTRKTELRSWRTLFDYLPPVQELFEESLQKGQLKTAGGFLLILHTFDEDSFNAQQIARLLRPAREKGDWDLCKELARFLVGIDDSGAMLKAALVSAGMHGEDNNGTNGSNAGPASSKVAIAPVRNIGEQLVLRGSSAPKMAGEQANGRRSDQDDYFSLGRR